MTPYEVRCRLGASFREDARRYLTIDTKPLTFDEVSDVDLGEFVVRLVFGAGMRGITIDETSTLTLTKDGK